MSARYGGVGSAPPAIERVSLVVGGGTIAALIGPNGSGKSTLLRVVAGLIEPFEGDVWVAGFSLRGIDRRLLARYVAFLPQTEQVALGFRVREVVGMGRAPHQGLWLRDRAEDREATEEALTRCDLVHLAARRVEELSGGEQRRVSLARALAQRPRVLLLDEPAAFLDIRHRLELYDLLAEVAVRDGIACVVAMHELDAAANLASQVVLLRAGRVVRAGNSEEVMTPNCLRETLDVDVCVHSDVTGRRYFAVRRTPA